MSETLRQLDKGLRDHRSHHLQLSAVPSCFPVRTFYFGLSDALQVESAVK